MFMDKVDVKERRQFARVSMDLEMEVFLLSDTNNGNGDISSLQCHGRDISGGGVSFFTDTQFKPESLLRLRISFDAFRSSTQTPPIKLLKVMGKVMWCRKNDEKKDYIAGVEFLNIYEDDFKYLLEFVNNNNTVE